MPIFYLCHEGHAFILTCEMSDVERIVSPGGYLAVKMDDKSKSVETGQAKKQLEDAQHLEEIIRIYASFQKWCQARIDNKDSPQNDV